VIRELSPRSHDMIVGCGERLAAGVISGVLRDNQIPSVAVDLSNIFPDGLNPGKVGYHLQAQKVIHTRINPLLNDTEDKKKGSSSPHCNGISWSY